MNDLDVNSPVEEIIAEMKDSTVPLPLEWRRWSNMQQAHRVMANDFIANIPEYDDDYTGTGIVICGGGTRLFTNAYVCIRMLRHLGCKLPIQLWHLADEIDERMRQFVDEYGVECIDASQLREKHPMRILHGWELKAYSIVYSSFQNVLLLDADNVPVQDPTFLFDCEPFQKTGAIFWPDYGKLGRDREIWSIFDTDFNDHGLQYEFESGQIVVDKKRCWRELQLSLFMNAHSDYYYHFIHGDKCTFEMAWKRLKSPFHLVKKPIKTINFTMCQHSPTDNSRLFQHRNMDKWNIDGKNHKINDFWYEGLCLDFVRELRDRWFGSSMGGIGISDYLVKELVETQYMYKRVGYDQRPMTFLIGGTVDKGSARCERFWKLSYQGGSTILTILNDQIVPTCHLTKKGKNWEGRWLMYEKMPIMLEPMD